MKTKIQNRMYRLLAAVQTFAAIFAIGFGILFFTAPSLFGIHFISISAVSSILIYAAIGAVLGWFIPKNKTTIVDEECDMHVHTQV